MSAGRAHALQPYWDLLLAGVQADALDAALGVHLFDALVTARPAAELAAELRLEATALSHVMDLLSQMGLLERHACRNGSKAIVRYRNAPVAQRFLMRASPLSCSEAWRFRLQSLRGFGRQIPQFLQTSATRGDTGSGGRRWADAARNQLDQEQRGVSVPAALAVFDALSMPEPVRHFADLGGGPGRMAIAMAQRWPQAHGDLIELPEPAEVARTRIAEAGLEERIRVRSGGLAQDAPASGYDLVWCSSVLHFVPDPAATLADIHAAFAPGGLLISAHAEIYPDAATARKVMTYYLPLRLRGCHVMNTGELTYNLHHAGFASICEWTAWDFPVAPLRIHAARRAA